MSLIQDALKRKNEDAPGQAEPGADDLSAIRSTPKTPPPSTSMPRIAPVVIFSTLIALVLLAAGGAYMILMPPKSAAPLKEATQTAEQSDATQAAATATAPAPKPEAPPPPSPAKSTPQPEEKPLVQWPEISFSGTASGRDEKLAIINGSLLSKNDSINDITVLEIEADRVQLEYQGDRRTFRLD